MNKFDLIIIGGGAAGQMAAISAKKHHPDLSVAILDRTFALGRKILVCGAGRCNITNINLNKSFADHYYGASSEFIESIFNQFSYQNIVDFFNDLGVELYVERKTDIGKLFPVTDQAKTVTALLEDELDRLDVKVYLNHDVVDIKRDTDFNLKVSELNQEGKAIQSKEFSSKYLILSAGGKTYPALGSNGSGYRLAESLGHSIIEPVPSALPIVSKNQLSHELQGTKMEIEVTSIINGKEIKTRTDDVMFTQYGLSGPAILNISREISIQLNRNKSGNCQVKLNFYPGKSKEDVTLLMQTRWNKRPQQTVEKSFYGIFPNKIAYTLIKAIGINPEKSVKELNEFEIDLITEKLTNCIVDVQATRSWNEAEFTAGGVDTTQVKQQTLESSKIENLYMCGEILDVDGDVGGFNLSWAWCSGYVAGILN